MSSYRKFLYITPAESSYKWHKADYDAIAQCIYDIDWDAFLCYNPSALSSWYAFVQLLWSAVDRYVPHSSGRTKINNRKHYPSETRKLVAKKNDSCGTAVDKTLETYMHVGSIVIVATH